MTMLPFPIPPANETPVNFSVVVPLESQAPRHSLASFLREAWRRHQSRTRLAYLDDHLLKDIGLTRADAGREYTKPFWRA